MRVDKSASSGGKISTSLIFYNMKVFCVFSIESPHWGDSNQYTQYTIFNIKKKITLNYPKFAAIGFCFQGLRNEFETAVVNKPSVFEPLKFNCICKGVEVRPTNQLTRITKFDVNLLLADLMWPRDRITLRKLILFMPILSNIISRVATVREKYLENEIFSRSGKSHGILWMAREI